jgi:hypothetical protein
MVICGLILALICLQTDKPSSKTVAENDIREAVFRYQFDHDATQQKTYTKVYFISIENEKDPDDEFLRRFAGNTPMVKKKSQAVGDNKGTGGVIDHETRGSGIIYRITQLKWVNENEVEVEADFHVAMLFAGGCKYRVRRENNQWLIKGWISQWES